LRRSRKPSFAPIEEDDEAEEHEEDIGLSLPSFSAK